MHIYSVGWQDQKKLFFFGAEELLDIFSYFIICFISNETFFYHSPHIYMSVW